jgi:hypothetical protein
MQRGRQYRLKTATMGLASNDDHPIAVTIPANAIVTFAGPSRDDSRLVDVQWQEKTFALFALDMMERGEAVRRVT